MELFRREQYLSKIRGFYHDTDLIKVITGVRRCGKSSLMQMIRDNFAKYVVTTDYLLQRRNGIYHINILEFIKAGKKF